MQSAVVPVAALLARGGLSEDVIAGIKGRVDVLGSHPYFLAAWLSRALPQGILSYFLDFRADGADLPRGCQGRSHTGVTFHSPVEPEP